MTVPNPRPNPYVGPRAFKRGEKLYGRDRELQQLLDLLIAERIVLLHSPSGAGKSSLIQAGLIHRLADEGFTILPVIRVHLESPIDLGPIECANPYVFSALLSLEEGLPAEQQVPLEKLAGMSMEEYLAVRPKDPEAPDSIVLIFDQFEEILTLNPTDRPGRVEFFSQVGAVLRDRRRWALFAVREDYLAGLDPYLRPIPTRLANTFRLDLLGFDGALQAIQQPAHDSGVEFTSEAASKLIDDLRRIQVQQPDGSFEIQGGLYVEPVQLQVVCFRLWQNLAPQATQITLQDLAAVGDVNQSLADYYAERVHAAAQENGVSERSIRRWFDEQLITERGIRSQVLLEKEQSAGLKNSVIWYLEGAHLVRGEKRRGVTWFELSHDRLIEPVRQNNAAWEQANLSLLQRQAILWERENRPDHMLLRDQALADAEAWAIAQTEPLTPTEQDYLEASRMEHQHTQERALRAEQALKLEAAEKLAEAEKRRAEDQERAAARLRRRALYLATALFIATLMTVLAGFSLRQAFNKNEEAQNNLSTANLLLIEVAAQKLTAEALSEQHLAQKGTAEAALKDFIAQRATSDAASLQVLQVAQQAQPGGEGTPGGASDEVNQAVSKSLASLALNALYDDPQRALLLAVEAYRTSNTQEARSALMKINQTVLGQEGTSAAQTLLQQDQPINQIAFDPKSQALVAASAGGSLYRLDINQPLSGETLATLPAAPVALWVASDQEIRASTAPQAPQVQPAGDHLLGIDFGKEGGNRRAVDWGQVSKEGGIAFAYIKATEGSEIVDPQFAEFWQGAKDAGIHRGAYHYFIPTEDPDSQAKNFLSTLPDYGELPLALYVEQTGGRSAREIAGKISSWVEIIEKETGNPPVIYLPIWFWNDYISKAPRANRGWAGELPLWASTQSGSLRPPLPAPWSQWTILQYVTGARVKGISGSVNFDRLALANLDISVRGNQSSGAPQLWQLEGGQFSSTPAFSDVIADGSLSLVNDGPAMFSPAGDLLAWAINGGGIAVWQVDGQYLATNLSSQSQDNQVTSMAFSPDRNLLAVGYLDGNLELYDLNAALKTGTGAPLSTSQPLGPTPITSMQFSANGRRLAVGGGCKEVSRGNQCIQAVPLLVLDFQTQKPLFPVLTGHSLGISSLAFSPDGTTFASGSEDHSILLWDLATGQPIGDPLAGHTGTVTYLAFSPDSTSLASGGQDGQVLLWSMQSDALATQACQAAGRNLTSDEWSKYFYGQPYHKTCPDAPGPGEIPSQLLLTPAPQSAP